MSDEKKYYWLRLKRDFFKRHDIQIIEGMPNGKDYILFYLKLLCESVDHEGNLRFSDEIPYNEQMLSTITNTNIDIVRTAIKAFTDLGMMDILDDGTLYMNGVEKMIGTETYWAERKRKQRALPKLGNGSTRLNAEMLRLPDGTTRYVDEKRYGGNGMLVLDRAEGKCEICGSTENVVIHHNNGYSNEPQDLICLCSKCHGKVHSGEIVPPMSNECPTCPSKSIEIEKYIEIDKKKNNKKEKPPRHKYGRYKNVLLSDEDIEKLKKEFPDDYEDRIENVSEYCQSKGKTYSDYLATIRNWARKERKRNGQGDTSNTGTSQEEREREIEEYLKSDEYRESLNENLWDDLP